MAALGFGLALSRVAKAVAAVVNFPTISAEATTINTGATSHTFNLPVRTAGQLLVAICALDGAVGPSGGFAGWTAVGTTNVLFGASFTSQVYSRVATNDASDAFAFTTAASEASVCVIYAATGAATAEQLSLSGGIDPPNLVLSGGSKKALWLAVVMADRDTSASAAAPTSYTDLLALGEGTSSSAIQRIFTARRSLEAASENPGAFTNIGTALDEGVITIALIP